VKLFTNIVYILQKGLNFYINLRTKSSNITYSLFFDTVFTTIDTAIQKIPSYQDCNFFADSTNSTNRSSKNYLLPFLINSELTTKLLISY